MPAPIKWRADFDVIPDYPNNSQSLPWIKASPTGTFGVSFSYDWGLNDVDYHWTPFSSDGTIGVLVNGSAYPAPINESTSSFAYLANSLRNVQVWTVASALGGGTGVDIYFKIIGGSPSVFPTVVRNGAGDQVDPIVAASATGDFAIAFIDTNVPDNAVAVRFYDTNGALVTEVTRSGGSGQNIFNTGGDFRDVALTALANGNYVVAWSHLEFGRPQVRGQVYTSLGATVGAEFIVGNAAGATVGGAGPDIVAIPDGRFLVVQVQGGSAISGQFFLATGAAFGGAFLIGSNANSGTSNRVDAALLNDGRFVVVWQDNANGGDIVGQILHANGTLDGSAFTVNTNSNGAQKHPTVDVLEDGRFVVAWEDLATSVQRDTIAIFDPRESGISTNASALNDEWIGTNFVDNLNMGLGDDAVRGDNGNDVLNGENGNDRFIATGALDGADTMDGGADVDTADYSRLHVSNGILVVLNGASNATVTVLNGNNDTVRNIENVIGGAGDDTLTGDSFANKLTGGLGDDLLAGRAGNDTLDGGLGVDTASYVGASGGVEVTLTNVVNGVSGGFSSGADGIDTLIDIENVAGSTFNDVIRGNSSANTLAGNAGIDTVSYSYLLSANGISLTLNGNIPSIVTIAGGLSDVIVGFENVIGGAGADYVNGDNLDNVFTGGNGNDIFYGNGGNDRFIGTTYSDGSDIFDGGSGIDTIQYTNLLSGNHINVALNGSASVTVTVSGWGSDTISNVENFISGAGSDTISGDLLDNRLDGGSGNDTLTTGGGNDLVIASLGFDTITDFTAGGIQDVIDVSSFGTLSDFSRVQGITSQVGSDTIVTFAFDSTVIMQGVASTNLTAADYTLAAPGIGNGLNGNATDNTLSGTTGIDVMDGAGGDDVLLGLGGDDILIGGTGIDYLYSGIGTNTLSGGAGLDILVSEGTADIFNGGADQNYYYRQAAGASQSFGGDGVDILVGGDLIASSDLFYGFGGDDYALGGAGNDELIGGNGNDILIGGDNNDRLDGGLGVNYLYADGTGYDTVRVDAGLNGTQTQILSFFEAGGATDHVEIKGSTLTSFAQFQTLAGNLGVVNNGNLLQNTGSGAVLTLGLGTANQTDIWFLGTLADGLTSTDLLFFWLP